MRQIRPITLLAIVATSMAAVSSGSAQQPPIQFRVTPAQGNPTGCTSLDAALSRVHTMTPAGDKAVLKSAGGIDDTLQQTAPGVYKTTFQLGGVTLDVVANASKAPRTLSVVEAKRGCRWNAATS